VACGCQSSDVRKIKLSRRNQCADLASGTIDGMMVRMARMKGADLAARRARRLNQTAG